MARNGGESWNGGGHVYNYQVGFGYLDSRAAVRLAEHWLDVNNASKTSATGTRTHDGESYTTDGQEVRTVSGVKVSGTGSTHSITFSAPAAHDMDIDEIELIIDWDGHPQSLLGNTELRLISPDKNTADIWIGEPATSSITTTHHHYQILDSKFGKGTHLSNEKRAYSTGLVNDDWNLGVQGFRDTRSAGTWTLEIVDQGGGLTNANFTGVSLLFKGDVTKDNMYVFTDDYGKDSTKFSLNDVERETLDVEGLGDDTINFAAFSDTKTVSINLNKTENFMGTATIGNKNLTINGIDDVENIIGGDGADTITGNALGNKLFGGRGNDTIKGGAGNDMLVGDYGRDKLDGGSGTDVVDYKFDILSWAHRLNPGSHTIAVSVYESENNAKLTIDVILTFIDHDESAVTWIDTITNVEEILFPDELVVALRYNNSPSLDYKPTSFASKSGVVSHGSQSVYIEGVDFVSVLSAGGNSFTADVGDYEEIQPLGLNTSTTIELDDELTAVANLDGSELGMYNYELQHVMFESDVQFAVTTYNYASNLIIDTLTATYMDGGYTLDMISSFSTSYDNFFAIENVGPNYDDTEEVVIHVGALSFDHFILPAVVLPEPGIYSVSEPQTANAVLQLVNFDADYQNKSIDDLLVTSNAAQYGLPNKSVAYILPEWSGNLDSNELAKEGVVTIDIHENHIIYNTSNQSIDLNDDGVGDIALSTVHASSGKHIISVMYGGWEGNATSTIALDELDPSDGFAIHVTPDADTAGYKVFQPTDLNGDGYNDFVLTPVFDSTNISDPDSLDVFVVWGRGDKDYGTPIDGGYRTIDLDNLLASEGVKITTNNVPNGLDGIEFHYLAEDSPITSEALVLFGYDKTNDSYDVLTNMVLLQVAAHLLDPTVATITFDDPGDGPIEAWLGTTTLPDSSNVSGEPFRVGYGLFDMNIEGTSNTFDTVDFGFGHTGSISLTYDSGGSDTAVMFGTVTVSLSKIDEILLPDGQNEIDFSALSPADILSVRAQNAGGTVLLPDSLVTISSDTASKFLNVTLSGNAHDNEFHGASHRDYFAGGAGDDILFGHAGDDFLFGGDGDDILDGGDGNDTIDGGEGVDRVRFATSDKGVFINLAVISGASDDYNSLLDVFSLEPNTETYMNVEEFQGSHNDDVLLGDYNANTLLGGKGRDFILGDETALYFHLGDDTPSEVSGSNVLDGGEGNDFIVGGAGDDALYGGNGHDILRGGQGDDVFYGGDGEDIFVGGAGVDTVYFNTNASAVTVDLLSEIDHSYDYFTFGNLIGSGFDDLLFGDENNNEISGGDGNDQIYVFEGNNHLSGQKGNDTIYAGLGDDVILGGEGNDTLFGDFVSSSFGDNLVQGGSFQDFSYSEFQKDLVPTDPYGSYFGNDDPLSGGWMKEDDGYVALRFSGFEGIQDRRVGNGRSGNGILDGNNVKAFLDVDSGDNGPNPLGGVYQDIATFALQTYTLSFWYYTQGNSHDLNVDVLWNGEKIDNVYYTDERVGKGWHRYRAEVEGQDGLSQLMFKAKEGDDITEYGYIDDVELHQYAGGGNDTLDAGKGNDKIEGYLGNDIAYASEGDDKLDGGEGFDKLLFTGNIAEYEIRWKPFTGTRTYTDWKAGKSGSFVSTFIEINHKNNGADGTDQFHAFEELRFADKSIDGQHLTRILREERVDSDIFAHIDTMNPLKSSEANEWVDLQTIIENNTKLIVSENNGDTPGIDIFENSDASLTFTYASSQKAVTVSLSPELSQYSTKKFAGIEIVHASNHDDVISGDASDNIFYGGDGHDRINGVGGSNSLYGQEGNDTIYGGTDNDMIEGGNGNDRIIGDSAKRNYGDNLIQNGAFQDFPYNAFENDFIPSDPYGVYFTNNDPLPGGWMKEDDGLLTIRFSGYQDIQDRRVGNGKDGNGKIDPYNIKMYLDIDSGDNGENPLGGIYQEIATNAQESYMLSFWYYHEDGDTDLNIDALWNGEKIDDLYFTDARDTNGWRQYHTELEASDSSSQLMFKAKDGDATKYGYIDDVELRQFAATGDDTLIAGEGDDSIEGKYGNDVLYASKGNDKLSGGDGFDEIIFTGNLSEYDIRLKPLHGINTYTDWHTGNSGIFVSSFVEIRHKNDGADGVDYFSSIEKMRFADESVYGQHLVRILREDRVDSEIFTHVNGKFPLNPSEPNEWVALSTLTTENSELLY